MSNRVSILQKNLNLKQELKQITGVLEEAGTAIGRDAAADTAIEEEDDDDDEIDELPEVKTSGARQSVSAEAYGQWNQKKAFTPPVIAKTDEQKDRLTKTLEKSFMFASLEAKDMNTIIMAMNEKNFEKGTKVIKEGEDGDYLFVIEKGSLDCIKQINNEEKVVKTCNPGDVFGELALLYNCPRAASVVAKDQCICWQLDRDSFGHIVKDAAMKRRQKYETFLQGVTLIASVDQYERSQIADALKPETFKKGEVIVKQDEPGDKFYIVEEGSLFALKLVPGGGEEKRVMDYKTGDYFGELALLKNQPRAASVVVESESAKVLSMARGQFVRLLGPLKDILHRQANTKYS